MKDWGCVKLSEVEMQGLISLPRMTVGFISMVIHIS